MPRYFFHIKDGTDFPDLEGTELAGWREAQIEAIRIAGDVIADSARQLKLGEDWSMDVTDDHGLILFRLDFHIAGSAGLGTPRESSDPA